MIFCIIGPSGSGKTSFVNEFIKNNGGTTLVSDTTRPIRSGEKNGIDYNFVDENAFLKKDYIESTKYNNNLYGLSLYEFNNKCRYNKIVFFICDIYGYKNIIKKSKTLVRNIYISTNEELCMQRMLKRGDSKEAVLARLMNEKAVQADIHKNNIIFDYVIVNNNDDFSQKYITFENIIKKEVDANEN